MRADVSLLDHLADALPLDLKLRVFYLCTPSTQCPALFAAPPGQQEEQTRCESHLIGFTSPGDEHGKGVVLVFALEILIYTTSHLTTIFVSKADSSGFLGLLRVPVGSSSVVKTLTESYLEHLIHTRSSHSRLVLSLFARSQNQYLFPGSIENAGKHLLDDRQLIKWWCRILDSLIHIDHLSVDAASPPTAYLLVPGCDRGETRAFFPPIGQRHSAQQPRWVSAYPVDKLVRDSSAPPRCLVPRFSDDPKARFLDDLDGAQVPETGHWRSIKSLDQFWEMMSYRQECSAGRLVGFIWAIFEQGSKKIVGTNGVGDKDSPHYEAALEHPGLSTPAQSQVLTTQSDLLSDDLNPVPLPKTPPPSSPPPLTPSVIHLEVASSFISQPLDEPVKNEGPGASPVTARPRDKLMIDAENYEILMAYLLELDFAEEQMARKNTADWIEKAEKLAISHNWGQIVVGRNVNNTKRNVSTSQEPRSANVNILTSIRKKRKAEPVLSEGPVSEAPCQMMNTNLIRKKPKT